MLNDIQAKRLVLVLVFSIVVSMGNAGVSLSGVVHAGATYYIAPNGSDENNGTSPTTPWLTPNHSLKCGDEIFAATGNYSSFNFLSHKWGIVSECPTGAGMYFARLLCAGPDVGSCSIADTSSGAMVVDQSNWAVIGWSASSTAGGCFNATPSGPANIHYVAFINVVANGCQSNGISSFASPSNNAYGVDQFAVVGAIAYDAARGADYCYSGVSDEDPRSVDSSSGTHVFFAGIFSYRNINPIGCGGGLNSDGEGITFDDWASKNTTHRAYTGQGVIEQSLLIGNGGAGISVGRNTAAKVYITSTTAYGNLQFTSLAFPPWGELLLGQNTARTSAIGNIFQASVRTQNSGHVYGVVVNEGNSNNVVSGNYIFGVEGNNTEAIKSGGFSFGANTIETPNFISATIPGAPNCSGYATTTACMATTIGNFMPQAAGAKALGYHLPGPCAADPYFPIWLSGILPKGLITQPCGS